MRPIIFFTRKLFPLLAALLLVAGCGGNESSDVAKGPRQTEAIPANWYLRIVAENPDQGLRSLDAQLGILEEENATAVHALKALTPFGGRYLDVVFRNPSGVDPGDYKSSFRTYEEGIGASWDFVIRSGDPNAEILVGWRGLYRLTPYTDSQGRTRYKEFLTVTNPLLRRMELIDPSTGMRYPALVDGKPHAYRFSMNGSREKRLQWVLHTDTVETDSDGTLGRNETARIGKAAFSGKEMGKRPRSVKFDLSRPPVFKEDHNETE
jgi:hypothetical protein